MNKKYIYLLAQFITLIIALLVNVTTQANDSPVATDDYYETTSGDNMSVDAPGVLSNDYDSDNDQLTAVLTDDSQASGALFLYDDGSFEYEPEPGFFGIDIFSYVANDGTIDSNEATITFNVTFGGGEVTIFTDQGLFLDALAAMNHTSYREEFEDDNVWGEVRTTVSDGQQTSPSIKNLGITWTANNEFGEVTTGEGPVRRGKWGFFTLPHGSYLTGTNCDSPINCGDGWRGNSDIPLVGVGGWVETNTPYAGLHIYLDGNLDAPIDFDGEILDTRHKFFGVISPSGFNQFEYRETEGTMEDAKYIFADDYYFAYETNLSVKVSRILMKLLGQVSKVVTRVKVVDQDKVAVIGAVVDAQWTLPDETIIPFSGTTNTQGRIKGSTPNVGSGDYTLSILRVSLPDHVYLGGQKLKTLNVP